jgi:hypothetical protein
MNLEEEIPHLDGSSHTHPQDSQETTAAAGESMKEIIAVLRTPSVHQKEYREPTMLL